MSKHDENCTRRRALHRYRYLCTCGVTDEEVAEMSRGFCVWLQGGPANDLRYETMIEPPDRIKMYPLPGSDPVEWTRVFDTDDWPGAVRYERVRRVEQVDGECIYYPTQSASDGEGADELPSPDEQGGAAPGSA